MKLYTSHPPAFRRQQGAREIGPDYLRQCVQSWTNAGFDLVSVNDPSEIAACERLDLGLTYVPRAQGRPRIADLLDCVRESGEATAGIVNADCLFLGSPQTRAALVSEVRGSMVLLERLNICATSGEPTGVSCFGFDAFLFDVEVLTRITIDQEFKIGEPWWDYWLPMSFARAGGSLKRSRHFLLTHADHPMAYSQEQYLHHGRRMYRTLAQCCGLAGGELEAAVVDPQVIGAFACLSFAWIRSHAAPVDFRAASEDERPNGMALSQKQSEAMARAVPVDVIRIPGPQPASLEWQHPRRSDRRLGEFCCTLARLVGPALRGWVEAERLSCKLHRLGAALQLRASINRLDDAARLESLRRMTEIYEVRSRLPIVDA